MMRHWVHRGRDRWKLYTYQTKRSKNTYFPGEGISKTDTPRKQDVSFRWSTFFDIHQGDLAIRLTKSWVAVLIQKRQKFSLIVSKPTRFIKHVYPVSKELLIVSIGCGLQQITKPTFHTSLSRILLRKFWRFRYRTPFSFPKQRFQ